MNLNWPQSWVFEEVLQPRELTVRSYVFSKQSHCMDLWISWPFLCIQLKEPPANQVVVVWLSVYKNRVFNYFKTISISASDL